MFEKRLPMSEVDRLINEEGKSISATARILGFSKQAVSQALQKRKKGSERVPAKFTGAKTVSDFEGLRMLKRVMSPVFGEIKFLNFEIGKLKDEEVKGEDRKNLNFQRLKYIAEGRKQLALALLIDEKRFAFEEVLKFQNFVLEKIGEIDETARDEILERLRGGRALRRALDQSG